MEESEDNSFVPTQDTLKYRAVIPKPYDAIALEAKFADRAVPGQQGGIKTLFIDDKPDSGKSAYATRSRIGKWHLNLDLGEEEEGTQIDLGHFTRVENVKNAAAKHLAASVLEIKDMIEQAKQHLLKQNDIVEVQVGETDRVIKGDYNLEAQAGADAMVYEAEIPMPEEYQAIFDRYVDTMHNNHKGTMTFGDHVSGLIVAQQEDSGKWTALGQGDLNYRRSFGKDIDEDDIVREICEDLASLDMPDEMILNHIRRHGVRNDEIRSINLNGRDFDLDPDFETPEMAP